MTAALRRIPRAYLQKLNAKYPQPVTEAVITVPRLASTTQRVGATKDAGQTPARVERIAQRKPNSLPGST